MTLTKNVFKKDKIIPKTVTLKTKEKKTKMEIKFSSQLSG